MCCELIGLFEQRLGLAAEYWWIIQASECDDFVVTISKVRQTAILHFSQYVFSVGNVRMIAWLSNSVHFPDTGIFLCPTGKYWNDAIQFISCIAAQKSESKAYTAIIRKGYRKINVNYLLRVYWWRKLSHVLRNRVALTINNRVHFQNVSGN